VVSMFACENTHSVALGLIFRLNEKVKIKLAMKRDAGVVFPNGVVNTKLI